MIHVLFLTTHIDGHLEGAMREESKSWGLQKNRELCDHPSCKEILSIQKMFYMSKFLTTRDLVYLRV